MSNNQAKKKRLSLHKLVQKLSAEVTEEKPEETDEGTQEQQEEEEQVASQDVPMDESPVPKEHKRTSLHRFLLTHNQAPPSSPAPSEASAGDTGDEAASSTEKETTTEEETVKEVGPQRPLRCGVCDLLLFKSYRHISRNSAPNHLRNFFKPEVDRFRVCKRCFSSKEKCRDNLALVLLKSKTEQMSHVRTPLGITHSRTSRALQYVTRDLSKAWKRPYEDLLCDETLDDDDLSDGEDTFLVTCEPKQPKIYPNVDRNSIDVKNIGVVTIVRPNKSSFQAYPNYYTIYGEPADIKVKEIVAENDVTIGVQEGSPLEKTEEVNVNIDSAKNGELKNEINSINEKLTLLDHAYALPAKAAKATKAAKTQQLGDENKKPKVSKPVDASKIPSQPPPKPAAPKLTIKTIKKEGVESTGEGGGPVRTCGIICSICDHLVTKSYSCYKKDNAPEKIKHLFTPDIKQMKVCRRCLPYKKPKVDGAPTKVVKVKGKILSNKIMKQKLKKAKKLHKSMMKGGEISTQTKGPSLTSKEPSKTSKEVPNEASKEASKEAPKEESKKCKIVDKVKIKKDVVLIQGMNAPVKENRTPTVIGGAFEIVDGKLRTKTWTTPTTKSGGLPTTSASSCPLGKPQTLFTMVYKPMNIVNAAGNLVTNLGNVFEIKKSENSVRIESGKKEAASSAVEKTKDSGSAAETPSEKTATEVQVKQVAAKEETKKNESTVTKANITTKAVTTTAVTTKPNPLAVKIDTTKKVLTEKIATKVETATKAATATKVDKTITNTTLKADTNAKTETITVTKVKEDSKTKETAETNDKKANGASEKLVKSVNKDTPPVESKPSRPSTPKPVLEPVRFSPRRDRGIIPPEKKNVPVEKKPKEVKENTENKVSSKNNIVTRKRPAGSESESVASKDEEEGSGKASKKKATVRKAKVAKKDDSNAAKEAADKDLESTDDSEFDKAPVGHSYSTRFTQSPILCACCKEKVIKSYRCVQLASSPSHLKPLFEKHGASNMRVCRKCLGFPSRVKSFSEL